MSWQSLVRGTLAEENPELERELLVDGQYGTFVESVADRMIETFETMTSGSTDENARAAAREIAIAQMRDEVALNPRMHGGN